MEVKNLEIKDKIPDKTVFFDGVCNLCNYWVQFVDKMDNKKTISLCHLQNSLGNIIQEEIFRKNSIKNLSTIIFYFEGRIYLKSTAVLKVMSLTSGKLSFFYKFLLLLPTFFRDFCYDIVGRTRYLFFGKSKECQIPNKNILSRFIHEI